MIDPLSRRWRLPPLPLVFVCVAMLALAETAGALLGPYRPEINAWLTEGVRRHPAAHGLTGSRDYDAVLIPDIVYQSEAGLSFFHTHGEGMPLIVLAGGTIVSSLVASRIVRGVLYLLLAGGAVFPLGFLAYAALIIPMGKDPAVEWAERWILAPTGSAVAAVFALLGIALVIHAARRRPAGTASRAGGSSG